MATTDLVSNVGDTAPMSMDPSSFNKTSNDSLLPPPYDTVKQYVYEYEYYGDYDDYVFNKSHCPTGLEKEPDLPPGYKVCIQILLPIVCSIGILGIVLTIIVLSRKNMSTSTNSYLISLAAVDLCFLLILLGKVVEGKVAHTYYGFFITMNYLHILLEILLLASVWLTVMLAVERYIAICHPMKAMSLCTVVRARLIIMVIFLVSIVCRIPKFFYYKLESYTDQCLDQEIYYAQTTDLGRNLTFKHASGWAINCFLSAIIPFSILLFLNGCLIREIHRSTNYLRYHLAIDSNVQTIITSEELKITMMLISVIIVFFVCQAPYVVLIALTSVENFSRIFTHYHLIRNITLLLLALRSSFNFILYCWFSEKFWNTFKRTFCQPWCLKRSPRWLSARITGNHSEPNYSNNNRKISYFNTKETIC